MTSEKRILKKDRLKDRSDIGEVEFPIEKFMKFRDASASCVHMEAAMEADRGLTDTGKCIRSDSVIQSRLRSKTRLNLLRKIAMRFGKY